MYIVYRTLLPGFSALHPLVITSNFHGIYLIKRRNYDSPLYLEGLWGTGLQNTVLITMYLLHNTVVLNTNIRPGQSSGSM